MSKLNQYGYSFEMNPKIKEFAKNYHPEDVSELTALRNRKPLRILNTVKKMELKGVSDPLSEKDQVNVCLTLFIIILAAWFLFNF